MWALACAGCDNTEVFEDLSKALRPHLNVISDNSLAQIYVATIYLRLHWPGQFELFEQIHLRSPLKKATLSPSPMRQQVSSMLQDLGWTHTMDYNTDQGFFFDFAQIHPDHRAIDFHGPHDTLQDLSSGQITPSGAADFKLRLARQCGWKCTSLSSHEWTQADNQADREQLLVEKLNAVH